MEVKPANPSASCIVLALYVSVELTLRLFDLPVSGYVPFRLSSNAKRTYVDWLHRNLPRRCTLL